MSIQISGSVLVVGAAEISEAEFETLDDVTAGTVAASKVVVVDANKDIASFRNLTATGALTGGSLVVGTADMSETDLEKLDGITNGAGAANKALVLDANADVASGLRNVTAAGSITAATSFIIGSADLNETDMEKLDGITNGTVAASKAVVVDASKDANGFRNIDGAGDLTMATITMSGFSVDADGDLSAKSLVSTSTVSGAAGVSGASLAADGNAVLGGSVTAGSSFIIGSADLNEADMEKLDGITNGTVAASKAVVVDADKDASGFRNVTAAGAITAGTSFIIGSADLNETDLEKLDGITDGTAAASKALVLDANKDASGMRDLSMRNVSASADVQLAGASNITGPDLSLSIGDLKKIDGIADAGYDQTADSVVFFDATDNTLKYDAADDFVGAIAGDGLGNASGKLKVQVGTNKGLALTSDALEITASAVASAVATLASDSFMFFDADGSVKEESFADLATLMTAGDTGLDAASGVLRLDLNELTAVTSVADADLFALEDATDNSTKKMTRANLLGSAEAAFSNGLTATTISASSTLQVDSAMTAAAGAFVVDADGDISGKSVSTTGNIGSSAGALSASVGLFTAGSMQVGGGAVINSTFSVANGHTANLLGTVNLGNAGTDDINIIGQVTASAGLHISGKTGPFALSISDGQGDAVASAWITHSDRGLKTNIQEMDNNFALEAVMKLQPSTYDKISTGKSEIGFIAQEVAEVVPEICAIDKTGEGRGIDYSRMSTLLAGALKAQQEQIAQLKEIVAKLQK